FVARRGILRGARPDPSPADPRGFGTVDFFTRHVDVTSAWAVALATTLPRQGARHAAPVMRAPARQVALSHAERLLCATQGVSSLASRGTAVMRVSIPSLAAAALIIAGCGSAPT